LITQEWKNIASLLDNDRNLPAGISAEVHIMAEFGRYAPVMVLRKIVFLGILP
jgi:hypothetical protein